MPNPYDLESGASPSFVRPSRQRSRMQTRFSALFHGRSNLSIHAPLWFAKTRQAIRVEGDGYDIFPHRLRANRAGLRSYTSTQSLIDPVLSPLSASSIYSQDSVERHSTRSRPERCDQRPWDSPAGGSRHRYKRRLRDSSLHVEAWSRAKRQRSGCFPNIKSSRARRKAIGALISGALLGLMLIFCMAASAQALRGK